MSPVKKIKLNHILNYNILHDCGITIDLVLQDPHESWESQLITPTKNEIPHGLTSSQRPPKVAPKRRGLGMSTVNPGSKRVHMIQGVKYEDDSSDS
jgi:hypothetical protein